MARHPFLGWILFASIGYDEFYPNGKVQRLSLEMNL
jgi:hypothetical protein